MTGMTAVLPCSAILDGGLADRIGLLHVVVRGDVAGGALQVVGDRIVILVAQIVAHHFGDDRRDAAQLGVAERVACAGLGQELAVCIGRAFADDDDAIAVVVDALAYASSGTRVS